MPVKTNLTFRDVLFCAGSPGIKCLKLFDYLFGGLVCFIWRPGESRQEGFNRGAISRILVIRPGGMGDAALAIPMIREIKKRFPGAQLDLLCEKRNAGVFSLAGDAVSSIFCYDNLSLFSLACNLRNSNYDVVFDTEQWHNLTAIIARFISPGMSVGFATRHYRRQYYSAAVRYDQTDYESESFLNLLDALSPRVKDDCLHNGFIRIPEEYSRWAKEIIRPQDKAVALCLSASTKEKSWPARNFREVADYLIGKGRRVLLLGGRAERGISAGIRGGLANSDGALDFTGKCNPCEAAALLDRSDFYIGLDSGILHIASLLDRPTISLFGPGNKQKWAPRGGRHIVLGGDGMNCSPCSSFGYTPRCRSARCMKGIAPEDVMAAIEELEEATQQIK